MHKLELDMLQVLDFSPNITRECYNDSFSVRLEFVNTTRNDKSLRVLDKH